MHHLFHPGMKITGFTGYGTIGAEFHYQQWQRLFYGHTGASIFWHYTMLNPDLTFSEQGRAMQDVFGRLQSGIGRVFMNSTVREDGVAIHFSMASIRGAWITDGKILPTIGNVRRTSKNYAELVSRRGEWVKQLEEPGLAVPLPGDPADRAGRAGQLPRADPALLDRHLRPRGASHRAVPRSRRHRHRRRADRPHGRALPLAQDTSVGRGRKGLSRQAPGPVPVQPAFPVEGEFLDHRAQFRKLPPGRAAAARTDHGRAAASARRALRPVSRRPGRRKATKHRPRSPCCWSNATPASPR